LKVEGGIFAETTLHSDNVKKTNSGITERRKGPLEPKECTLPSIPKRACKGREKKGRICGDIGRGSII